jgi:hypothetical protein
MNFKICQILTKKHEIYNSQNESYLKNYSCYHHEIFTECYSLYLGLAKFKKVKILFSLIWTHFLSHGHI